jgi:hypothetical protein
MQEANKHIGRKKGQLITCNPLLTESYTNLSKKAIDKIKNPMDEFFK